MIAIIDYGLGNLRSVEKAFHHLGSEAIITSDKEVILNADAVVLPGVGAFADAMQRLEALEMVEVIKNVVAVNKPFLGICLGMQLLFEYSEEGNGEVEGLGILKGGIKELPRNMKLKVPHIGWNSLNVRDNSSLFSDLPESPFVYFVHSYYLKAAEDIVIATVKYGIEFDAAVAKGNIVATQFHPEKSGDIGLQILANWVKLIQ